MKPIEFKEMNTKLTKPEGMTDEECSSLPAYVNQTESISCWELSDDDIMLMTATRRIWVRVVSGNGSQPPIGIQAETPFV